jgi:glycosyltransferase involved in cell wall biosynthesis
MTVSAGVLELRSVRGTGGGPDKTLFLTGEIARSSRFDATLCYIRDQRDPDFGPEKHAGRSPADYVEVLERHSFDWRIWPRLREIARSKRIRIVHAHDYKTNLLALLLARAEGLIPIATVHGWSGHTWREQYFYYPADRRLLKRYPRVIAVSSDIREMLVAAGAVRERVSVVLNGIDHRAFTRRTEAVPVARARFEIPEQTVVIGSVGRLEREKNFALLISAFARLARDFPGAILVIAGEGSLRSDLQSLATSLGISDRCRLLGHQNDIHLLHHALDLFVQSSDNEGTPNSILEAMALETPIVATDVGGTRELVRANRDALLVRRRDEEGLSRAMIESLAHPDAARARTAAARARVEQDLSFDARMQRIETIYDELLSSSTAAR